MSNSPAFAGRTLLALIVAAVCQSGRVTADDAGGAPGGRELVSDSGDAAAQEWPLPIDRARNAGPDPADVAGGAALPAAQQGSADVGDEGFLRWPTPLPGEFWTFEVQERSMFNSRTCYQFGTPPGQSPAYAPLSKLDFALDSMWTGFQIGKQSANWGLQFSWLTPTQKSISGNLSDYDWLTPSSPDHLDSLSNSELRWNDGQMLDLGGEFRLGDCILLGTPVEVWPMAGFRFQRFNMTGHDGVQIVGDWPGAPYFIPPPGTLLPGDLITFNQQYYMGYFGGQLRTTLNVTHVPPVLVTFQGDWGATAGYNIDHHLFYEQFGIHRYTMDSTDGGTLHLSLAAETPITAHFSIGLQLDHMEIRTTGSQRLVMSGNTQALGLQPVDATWNNGVSAVSDQTSLTAFIRGRF
jgi:hypothetical protein